jgi:F-type H+-transporting ATPase subunit epsilon
VDKLQLEIITTERVMAKEDVEIVEATSTVGEFGILPGHINFLALIAPCQIRYGQEGKTRFLATSGGFAEVSENKVTFLLNAAEFAEEIDLDRAHRAKERAETALREIAADHQDYVKHEAALMRAIARISTAAPKSL